MPEVRREDERLHQPGKKEELECIHYSIGFFIVDENKVCVFHGIRFKVNISLPDSSECSRGVFFA